MCLPRRAACPRGDIEQHPRRGRRGRAAGAEEAVGGLPRCDAHSLPRPRCAVPDRPSRVPCCRAGLRVYVSMIDEKLDEQGRIFPGLGDAGDRAYGTA